MKEKLKIGNLKNANLPSYFGLCVLFVIILGPLYWVFIGSFKTNFEIFNSPFGLPESWGLKNYLEAWRLGSFQTYFINSTFVTGLGMLFILIVACPAGYAFGQLKFKGNNVIFYSFLFGMALPIQTIIIPVFFYLRDLGLINTLSGLMLMSVSMALPFSVFLMRNTFKDVPKELRESAHMDGASEWTIFFKIMLPIAKPGVVALLVFTFMSIWNDFLLPLVLLISQDKFTVTLGLYSFQGAQDANFSLIFAGTIISMIPAIIIYVFLQRQFIEGMSSGSVK